MKGLLSPFFMPKNQEKAKKTLENAENYLTRYCKMKIVIVKSKPLKISYIFYGFKD
jgi:hypothetical protein